MTGDGTEPAAIPMKDRIVAGLLMLAGLVLAWLLQFVLPDWLRAGANGAIAGGFGVLAATRLWPGLPIRKLPWWLGVVVGYGVVVGIVARL